MNSVYELLILSAMALYLGDAFIAFFKSVSNDILTPLLRPFSKPIKEAEDVEVELIGVRFAIGKLVTSTVHLLFALFMAVIVLRLLDIYASGWIRKIYK